MGGGRRFTEITGRGNTGISELTIPKSPANVLGTGEGGDFLAELPLMVGDKVITLVVRGDIPAGELGVIVKIINTPTLSYIVNFDGRYRNETYLPHEIERVRNSFEQLSLPGV
jgi:hypothetical protein